MLGLGSGQQDRLKVFISYSRKDSQAFADELVAGLEYAGNVNITIDRHSIVEGEDWKKRLGALIADADTIVFIISPQSAASTICKWEVDEAAKLSKRILPVLWLPVGATPVPEQLAALNYTRFDEGRSFVAGLKNLITALNTDLDWLREHTRLLARAMEWDGGGRPGNRLMSGKDIADAKAWSARRPRNAPELTSLHLDFIKASEAAETHRFEEEKRQLAEIRAAQAERETALADKEEAQRAGEAEVKRRARLQRLLVSGTTIAAVVFGAFGFFSYNLSLKEKAAREDTVLALKKAVTAETAAEDRRVEAVQATAAAEIERNNALAAKKDAETEKERASVAEMQAKRERDLAQEGQSIFLAEKASTSFKDGKPMRSMMLSVEALPDKQRGITRPIVREAVDLALTNFYDMVTKPRGGSTVEKCTNAILISGGDRLIAGYGGIAEIMALPSLTAERRLGGHIAPLTALAAAKTAPIVATASEDNTARIWDARDGKLISVLTGHLGPVRTVGFDKTGRRAITVGDDGKARVWDVASGRVVSTFSQKDSAIDRAVLNPEGTTAVSASSTGKVWVWNAETGQATGPLDDDATSGLVTVEFYPDSSRILVVRDYGGPQAFDARTLMKAVEFDSTEPIKSVTFNQDGSRVAFGAAYNAATAVFDAVSGRKAFELENYTGTVLDMTFSQDGRYLATGSDDDTARIWDASNGQALATIKSESEILGSDVYQVMLTANGQTLVARTGNGVEQWDWKTSKTVAPATPSLSSGDTVVMAPKGADMLRIVEGGPVTLWGIGKEDLKQRGVLRALGGRPGTATFSPDGRWIALGTTDDKLGVWRTDTLEEVKTFDNLPAEKVAFSPDGEKMAVATRSLVLEVSDSQGRSHSEPAGSAIGSRFGLSIGLLSSEDGTRVAIGDGGQLLRLWDTSGPEPRTIATLTDERSFTSAVFSQDSRHLVTLSGDNKLRLWDTSNSASAAEAKVISEGVSKYEILDGNRALLGVIQDGTIQVWSTVTGELMFEVPRPAETERARDTYIRPSQTGAIFAVWRSGSGNVEVWDAQTKEQVSVLQSGAEALYTVTLSGDGRRAILKNDKDEFSTWDSTEGKLLYGADAKNKLPWDSADLNEDGTRLITNNGKTFELYDTATGSKVAEVPFDSDSAVSFSSAGQTITLQSSNGSVESLSAETGAHLKTLHKASGARVGVTWSKDAQRLVIVAGNTSAELLDGKSGDPIVTLKLDSGTLSGIDFSPDSSKVFTFRKEGGVTQWDATTGTKLADIAFPAGARYILSPDGTRIFAIRATVRANVFATSNWQKLSEISGHTDAITSLGFDREGKRLLTSSADGTAAIWDTADGSLRSTFLGHEFVVSEARFSPDEKLIATASGDGTVRLWEPETAASQAISEKFADGLSDLKFNANSTLISATRRNSSETIVWQIGERSILEKLKIPQILASAFTPDGTGFAVFKAKSMEVFDLTSGASRQRINLEKTSDSNGDGPFEGIILSEDARTATSKAGAVWTMQWTADDIAGHLRAMLPRCLTPEERREVHLGLEPPDWCVEMSKWPFDGPEWRQWLAEKRSGKFPEMPSPQTADASVK